MGEREKVIIMLTEKDREWARAWKRTPAQIEEMRQALYREEEGHGRLFYGRMNIDAFDEDEVKFYYMELQNLLVDLRMS